MSLTSALNIAQSGLNATGQRARVASSNIANVGTLGYVRRSVALVDSQHGGVGVSGIVRHADTALSELRRDAQSSSARSEQLSSVMAQLLTPYGDPNTGGGLQAAFDQMRGDLETLRNSPEALAAQESAAFSIKDFTASLNSIAAGQAAFRSQADQNIATDVETANEILNNLEDLNTDVLRTQAAGADTSDLLDRRDNLISELSEILPVNVETRDDGAIRIATKSGLTLLGETVHEIEFQPVQSVFAADISELEGGRLSVPTIGGRPIGPGTGTHALHDGRLSANLNLRDTAIPEQARALDQFAFEMADALQTAGMPILVDGAGPVDVTNITGLAGRLSIASEIDPDTGGLPSRLRDGLTAATPGTPGDDSRLNAIVEALSGRSGQFADLVDGVSSDTFRAERIHVGNLSREATLLESEAAQSGVDLDYELQSLIAIEQSYSANARVIQSINEMFDSLLRI